MEPGSSLPWSQEPIPYPYLSHMDPGHTPTQPMSFNTLLSNNPQHLPLNTLLSQPSAYTPQHPVTKQPLACSSTPCYQKPSAMALNTLLLNNPEPPFLDTLFSKNPQHLTLSVLLEWRCDGYVKFLLVTSNKPLEHCIKFCNKIQHKETYKLCIIIYVKYYEWYESL